MPHLSKGLGRIIGHLLTLFLLTTLFELKRNKKSWEVVLSYNWRKAKASKKNCFRKGKKKGAWNHFRQTCLYGCQINYYAKNIVKIRGISGIMKEFSVPQTDLNSISQWNWLKLAFWVDVWWKSDVPRKANYRLSQFCGTIKYHQS